MFFLFITTIKNKERCFFSKHRRLSCLLFPLDRQDPNNIPLFSLSSVPSPSPRSMEYYAEPGSPQGGGLRPPLLQPQWTNTNLLTTPSPLNQRRPPPCQSHPPPSPDKQAPTKDHVVPPAASVSAATASS